MAGLISTGIAGFLSSAKFTGKQILNKAGKLVPEVVSTFISGATGWIIKNNGDAEFKSIYARDKIVTNEYVHNRIRVTEDEEVVTSNGKILASFENEDGTCNVQLDLREGDLNPFTADDLLQGYYHSPGSTGAIYAVQKMTVMEVLDDQTMNVICLSESTPYKYMVIVRVGNTTDVDRQSFIRISSRTNCQYFYDEIASFADLDNPDKVKCAIGKTDPGLIPAWAVKAVGSVKRWFGLIADGVILRGTFILKNDKTIEDELNGRETELRSDFEIRETGITGKWEETITAAESASNSEKSVTKMVGDFQVTAEHLTADFTKTVETATTEATKDIDEAVSTAELKLELSAKGLELDLTNTINSEVSGARDEIKKTTEQSKSSLTQTATELAIEFSQSVTNAEGELMSQVGTLVTQNAKEWKVEVMGSDADGNPNTVIAAINATPEGIKIKGEKVEIDGALIAEIIAATNITTGKLTVIGGATIGGFSVSGNDLINSNFGASISIRDSTNDRYVYIGGGKNIIDVASYGSAVTGLHVLSNNPAGTGDNYAIRSYGRHIFGQRYGDVWNAPGVLWCGRMNAGGTILSSWGNGLNRTPSISRYAIGKYSITHNLGHTDYYPIAIAEVRTNANNVWGIIARYVGVVSNAFSIEFKNDGGNDEDPKEFQVMIFGRNKF